jgi:carbamoyl-phosphate synthase large subunit
MTAAGAPARRAGRHRRQPRRGAQLRRRIILAEIVGAVLWCIVGFHLLSDVVRRAEVTLAAAALDLLGVTGVAPTFGDGFLLYGPDGRPIVAILSASCSSLGSLLGLTALGCVVLRERPQFLVGLTAALAWVVLANQIRLLLSLLAGRYLHLDALIWFHDWVGALLNFVYTLVGLLIMIALAMYIPERAEQDASGRHTARRPDTWARPGLGYRTELPGPPPAPRIRLVALLHRYVLPRRLSGWLGARRERRRVDYRVGHLPVGERADRVRALAERGLGVHTATLVAVATFETEPDVLDALAESVAARQWEPISDPQAASLRLWARAWLMRTPPPEAADARLVAVVGAGTPEGLALLDVLRRRRFRVLALDGDAHSAAAALADVVAVTGAPAGGAFSGALLAAVTAHRPAALICADPHALGPLGVIEAALAELGCATWLPPPGTGRPAAGRPGSGAAFTADALVGRDGTLLTCVPRWEGDHGGTTFDSSAVTEAVAAVLTGHTGPATVTGTVADAAVLDADPDAGVPVAVTGWTPGFSAGIALTVAAGADVVSAYVAALLDPDAPGRPLTYRAGVQAFWYRTAVYRDLDGDLVAVP